MLWLTFASRRSLAQFRSMSFVLLMDATYKTNRFNLPLLIISSIDAFGKSYIVACSLLRHETSASYRHALVSFKSLFESHGPFVHTVVTDQEKALMNAISAEFPGTSQQLCLWHLEANVRKNFAKNPSLCSKFTRFAKARTMDLADQLYAEMRQNCSPEGAGYLERLNELKSLFVEAWVSRFRNLGIRSTQRAESLNRAFKRTLRTDCPLMDLFHALLKMSKSLEETRAFMSFQALDKPGAYPEPISHLAGVVSKYILDLLKGECAKSKKISIEGETTEGPWVFNDGHRFSSRNGCNCTFFAQYFAPCAHALKIGSPSLIEGQFHPCWLAGDVPITPPAIVYGPEPEPQVSEEDKQQAEATTLAASVYARLNDLPATTCIVFSKKFLQMLDQGNVNPAPAIRDPPITKSRGRPPKRKKNSFNGNSGFFNSY